MKKIHLLFICICVSINSFGQNENAKWYFGDYAALDFMTSPPTVLNNSAMNNGGSSIADASGNLLFYTNGYYNGSIWNKQHQVMANGTGLVGGGSIPLIIKHVNNPNLYYVFTSSLTPFSAPAATLTGLFYSVVDMSLAAGLGSVTVKNASVYNAPCAAELHATRHANGTDFWIMMHEYSYTTNNFRAYLLTSSGVNTTAVISSVGGIYGSLQAGTIKFSPTGQKLCIAVSSASVMLYDFNNTTGMLSNPLTLLSDPITGYYGCEFSPDGTKLYAGNNLNTVNTASRLTQWDLSAGNGSAIVSSSVNLMYSSVIAGGLQLAPDGKIYIASGGPSLSVINNPNAGGTNCNLVVGGQQVSAAINPTLNSDSGGRLPNMITNTTTTPCVTQTVTNQQSICAGNFYAIGSKTHTTAGNYIDTLINVFSCNGIVIVNTQLTVNNQPNITVSAGSSVCVSESLTLTASGANTYTWNSSIAGSQYTTSTFTQTGNFTYSVQLQGTSNAGCIATNNVSLSVSVQACDVGIKRNNLNWLADNIDLFPNPTSGNLNISYSRLVPFEIISYVITDNLGQCVLENEIKNNSASIPTSYLAPGLYQIHLKTQMGSVTKKFIKI